MLWCTCQKSYFIENAQVPRNISASKAVRGWSISITGLTVSREYSIIQTMSLCLTNSCHWSSLPLSLPSKPSSSLCLFNRIRRFIECFTSSFVDFWSPVCCECYVRFKVSMWSIIIWWIRKTDRMGLTLHILHSNVVPVQAFRSRVLVLLI